MDDLLIRFLTADPLVSNNEAEQLRNWPMVNEDAAEVSLRRHVTLSPIQRGPERPLRITPSCSG